MTAPALQKHTIEIANEAAMGALAARLAAHLRVGDVVFLDGALAAGKTFFTRALVHALGSEENVTSPTYTIANIYETAHGPVLHVDAYRLRNAQEFYGLGLDDYFDTGIAVIEWGERIDGFFDDPLQLKIDFSDAGESARVVHFTANGERSSQILTALEAK